MSPALSLYLAVSSAAGPLAWLVLRRRLAAGKEDPARLRERLGHAGVSRPEGRLVWFHAASVGESLSILPLIEAIRSTREDVGVLVTSGTVTSAELLAARLPKGVLHQFAPVDVGPAVTRFLDHWRPDLAVWIESEIWPRVLWSVGRRRVPALLLNARLSEATRERWRRLPGAAAELFCVFDYVQAQDDGTGAALLDLGLPPERLCVAGSFKQAADPLPCDEAELSALRQTTADRFVWVAASTHAGDEELALEAHRSVLGSRPDALLIIAPRHPPRGDEVAGLLDASGLPWSRRRDGAPDRSATVYLADTLGELGLWYRLTRAAYIGGSTGKVGGHNPYEPIALDVPVLHGPDTANFAAIYRDLVRAGATRCVRTSAELGAAIVALMENGTATGMAQRAAVVASGGSGALEKAVDAVLSRLSAANS